MAFDYISKKLFLWFIVKPQKIKKILDTLYNIVKIILL